MHSKNCNMHLSNIETNLDAHSTFELARRIFMTTQSQHVAICWPTHDFRVYVAVIIQISTNGVVKHNMQFNSTHECRINLRKGVAEKHQLSTLYNRFYLSWKFSFKTICFGKNKISNTAHEWNGMSKHWSTRSKN